MLNRPPPKKDNYLLDVAKMISHKKTTKMWHVNNLSGKLFTALHEIAGGVTCSLVGLLVMATLLSQGKLKFFFSIA
jgi:hypothetical protein